MASKSYVGYVDGKPVALAVEKSGNSKTGYTSVTYVSQNTCSIRCLLRGNGCYYEQGPVSIVRNRLTHADQVSQVRYAEAEAHAIDQLSGRLPLRVHVGGDCLTAQAARIVGGACSRYKARHGQRVWSYTHTWKDGLRRKSWGDGISILASCDTPSDVHRARALGYGATALTVSSFPLGRKTFNLATAKGLLKITPCLAQTGDTTCDACGLCMDEEILSKQGIVIGFVAHGAKKGTVQKRLLRQV